MSAATENKEGGPSLLPVAVMGAALTLLGPLLLGARSAVGVGLGALLALGNLLAISAVVRGFLRGPGFSWGGLAAVKFALVVLIAAVILKTGWAAPAALAVGYAALPLGIVLGQLFGPSARGEP
jgi:hypothetical protein